ncbi:hypothetical protein Metho_1700 [Methanomethylovorans hollandica DSM 15978]|uniref:DUF2119 domain-containing protein n=1 Tax=Methanomethylovorans hollandica (strain DSM 15978 / NBRC 107637 / DMS1) TaxID=867904 RepID=L0L0W4_METHD|nr:DUF2119 domain-containing protein [Methanomethylovorans hollandica]AGB49889.1 hypothetical protein Metho_1700 [Methanomethylovorans hollandica DSM 15978]
MKYKMLGDGDPIRLFVGGLHGNEWMDTSDILEGLTPPAVGSLAIIPIICKEKYVSTLEESYYRTLGRPIIQAVEALRPSIYIEFHSYSKQNQKLLTGADRIHKTGVPAYSQLDNDVLLGSVSPVIRKDYFPAESLCLSFEIQKENRISKDYGSKIAEKMKECLSKEHFIEQLTKRYPEQTKKVMEDYRNFYGL